MSTLRVLRNFCVPWVTTLVLACFSDAGAQTGYKVTDLGAPVTNGNLGCGMALNNQGWTLIQSGNLLPGQQDKLGWEASKRASDPANKGIRSPEEVPFARCHVTGA